jgi:hypothetical protein
MSKGRLHLRGPAGRHRRNQHADLLVVAGLQGGVVEALADGDPGQSADDRRRPLVVRPVGLPGRRQDRLDCMFSDVGPLAMMACLPSPLIGLAARWWQRRRRAPD